MNEPLQVLKQYWGYPSFRPSQETIIHSLLEKKDTLAILPTGGGKSICYQIPSLIFPGCALVISPLIALMLDQISDLHLRNIAADVIHSGMKQHEIISVLERAANGELKFLYCSPERLSTQLFLDYVTSIDWNFLIIDEAHCISEWGHDFRPQYLNIKNIKPFLKNCPVAAFTASATQKTREDILSFLQLQNPNVILNSVYRKNIHYHVQHVEHKESVLIDLLSPTSNIVYCNTRKLSETTASFLKSKGYNAKFYHAGLSTKERSFVQNAWLQSDSQTICSTNAFGMGINKPNVRQVFHMNAPYSLEAYYQEAGRAGRDEKDADAILLTIPNDKIILRRSISDKFPSIEVIKHVYDFICRHLNIAINDGFEEKFFIDIPSMFKKSEVPLLQFMSAIKLLESEDYWQYNQDDISPNYVQILCVRDDIFFLEKQYPFLHEIIICLLRTYGEILHFSTPISIQLIAEIMKKTYNEIMNGLELLSSMNFIDWKKNKSGSSIYFTQARVPKNFIFINEKKLAWRKQIFIEKINKMIEYAFETTSCRQRFLAEYFGEKITNDCGHCDVCKKRIGSLKSSHIKTMLFNFLKEKKTVQIQELFENFKNIGNKENIFTLLNELKNDELIFIDQTSISFLD